MIDYSIKNRVLKSVEKETLDLVLSRLEGVKRVGSGWIALCPAHDDHKPSLSIGVGSDGRVLLHCFAGCSVEEICSAIGIEVRDLFPKNGIDLDLIDIKKEVKVRFRRIKKVEEEGDFGDPHK